ncbi:proline-rich protein 2-like [Myotis myotis]|uniref:proline-rich protein 2-like n=1 Tax=Myotis myotis TaxID=51298 RepID=UPI00174CC078|nr:proline-rich protein 2-like [Myotis myotis]XP_036201410.1 proline-rich protein 2-like [Myotis myotis]XP_036201411.1 proline-rich protein 2-like [Myotis myotis]
MERLPLQAVGSAPAPFPLRSPAPAPSLHSPPPGAACAWESVSHLRPRPPAPGLPFRLPLRAHPVSSGDLRPQRPACGFQPPEGLPPGSPLPRRWALLPAENFSQRSAGCRREQGAEAAVGSPCLWGPSDTDFRDPTRARPLGDARGPPPPRAPAVRSTRRGRGRGQSRAGPGAAQDRDARGLGLRWLRSPASRSHQSRQPRAPRPSPTGRRRARGRVPVSSSILCPRSFIAAPSAAGSGRGWRAARSPGARERERRGAAAEPGALSPPPPRAPP